MTRKTSTMAGTGNGARPSSGHANVESGTTIGGQVRWSCNSAPVGRGREHKGQHRQEQTGESGPSGLSYPAAAKLPRGRLLLRTSIRNRMVRPLRAASDRREQHQHIGGCGRHLCLLVPPRVTRESKTLPHGVTRESSPPANRFSFECMNSGRRYVFQPPCVSDLSPSWETLAPPFCR